MYPLKPLMPFTTLLLLLSPSVFCHLQYCINALCHFGFIKPLLSVMFMPSLILWGVSYLSRAQLDWCMFHMHFFEFKNWEILSPLPTRPLRRQEPFLLMLIACRMIELLMNMTKLRRVNLKMDIIECDVSALRHHVSLERLLLCGAAFSDKAWQSIWNLPQLYSLDAQDCFYPHDEPRKVSNSSQTHECHWPT